MTVEIDVTRLIDRQGLNGFVVGVLALCTLVTLVDGYNISVVSFAAPAIARDWGLSRGSLGPLFSSSLLAGLIGPYVFGVLADRLGRRYAVIVSVLIIGVFGLLSGLCTSLPALVAARFIAGIGMSGALAVAVATINEFAPRRLRATFVTVVFSGTTIGSGLPGLVAAPLLAHAGWRAMLFIGGVVPLILALVVYWLLPESPKFLCLRPERSAQLALLLRRFDPRLTLDGTQGFRLADEVNPEHFSYAQLFSGKLVWLTPLLWFGAFVAMIDFQALNSWLPTLLTDAGVSFERASFAVVLFQFVGTLGGWVVMRPVDAFGMLPGTILYALAIPAVASLGLVPGGGANPLWVCALAGFCLLGLHFAQVSCVSSIYPTSIRGRGVGWFMLFGRAGGAVGPAVVGVLLGRHLSVSTVFYLTAVPLAAGLFASIAVTLVYRKYYFKKTTEAGIGSAPMRV